jgi:hypothetical protein
MEPSLQGVMVVASKFQAYCAKASAILNKQKVPPLLDRRQLTAFDAQAKKGSGALFTVMPTNDPLSKIPNKVFSLATRMRLQSPDLGNFAVQNGGEHLCGIGSCRQVWSLGHAEVCANTDAKDQRHNAMRDTTRELLTSTGVSHGLTDLRDDKSMHNRLAAAGVLDFAGKPFDNGAVGARNGADMLVHGLNYIGEETALDFTTISSSADFRVDASSMGQQSKGAMAATLAAAEEEKVNVYGKLYEPIGVSIRNG